MTTATLEPADAGPGLFLRFAQALSSRVVAPGDDAELRRQKSILVVAAVLKLACCPVWIVPYALLGHYAAAAAPAAYMCLCVASLLAFMRSKDIAAFRRRQSLSLLTMPALMQWSLGGFEASGGVIYWALLAPLLSLLFQGARESIKWFAAYAAVVVFSSLMPPFLDEPYARAVPHALNLAFFILNIVIVSGISFAILQYFHWQLGLEHQEQKRLNQALQARNGFIRRTFGRYLSDEIVEQLLRDESSLQLGGDKRQVTLLMSDLRGFAGLAEQLSPEIVVRMLNIYLGEMVEIIARHRGTVDEFIGDAILVLFGAPFVREDDAQRAVACAVEMQLGIARVNARFAREGLPEIEMGIGINTGWVIAGNIGSEKRAKYGVVGSQVNLTSRIESATVGGQVLISDSTLQSAGPIVDVGDTREILVKGYAEPIRVHALLGIGGELDLHLPSGDEARVRLSRPLRVLVAVAKGKAGSEQFDGGWLTELSERQATLRVELAPPPLSNLCLRLATPEGVPIPGDVYAKVIDGGGAGEHRLCFTSVPFQVRAFLRRTVAEAAPAADARAP